MPQYLTQPGIILKKISYSDADEIISVLLKDHGLQRFFVAGSRKSKKRYQGLIDHFAHLTFSYKESSKGLWRLHEVDVVRPGGYQAWQDLFHFAFGNYLAELICELIPEAVNDHDLYELWDTIELKMQQGPMNLLSALYFLTRVFEKTGYAIDFSRCMQCSKPLTSNWVHFDYVQGGLIGGCCSHQEEGAWPMALMQALTGQIVEQEFSDIELKRFLYRLIQFSQNILQKKSRAGSFLLDSIV